MQLISRHFAGSSERVELVTNCLRYTLEYYKKLASFQGSELPPVYSKRMKQRLARHTEIAYHRHREFVRYVLFAGFFAALIFIVTT